MKYCPGCESEFLDSVTRCEECHCVLINADQWSALQVERKQETDEIFVRAAVAGDRFEADVMKDALGKEGIPVLVRSFQDTSFDGIYVAQKGFAAIEVPESFLARARAVLESLVQPLFDS
jgi:Putative prokaryotic signal transducing protein